MRTQFHGSAFEYHRNEALDANNYFNNARNVPRSDLKYNDFGGALGGPVIQDKLFFFAGVEWKQIDRSTSPSLQTLPTSAMRAGDFSGISTKIVDPLTKQPFPGNVIPANRITADGLAFADFYDQMSQIANSYTDTPTANNALFQRENPFRWRQEMMRLDYNINSAHRLTARVMLDHYTLTEPYGTFIGGNLPTVPTDRNRPGWNIQMNHNWTISNSLLNEVKFNYSGNNQSIDPVGDTWKRSTYGFQFPQIYPSGGTFEDSIPVGAVSGYAGWQSASNALISPTKDFAFADTLTILKGAHTVKTGFLGIFNTKKQNGRSQYAGNVNFQSNGNPNSTGNAFADALLGNFRTYSEAQLDPIGLFRFWQLEAFVTDGWRVTPNFSVEVGLRYTYHYPTYTAGNNLTAFDPGTYDPAKAVTVNTNGTLVPGTGDRYNGLLRPGEVPEDQVANVPNANSPAVAGIPIAESRGIYDPQHLVMPRFSFAWSPGNDGKTSVRGGIGLYYDRPEGNLYFGLPNNPPFALSASYENGNLANPGGAAVPALAPWGSMQSVSTGFQIPRPWNWSFSVQRELPWWGLFGEIAYVGADGSNLMRRPDINLPSFADREANAAGPKYNTNYLRPYKGYADVQMGLSDASSSYNAAQVFLSKRRGDLTFTLNYTLGRAYDNGSGNFDNPADGPEDIQYYWGPSDLRPHTHLRRHLELQAALLQGQPRLPRPGPRRLGDLGHHSIPDGRCADGHRADLDRQPPGRLHRRRSVHERADQSHERRGPVARQDRIRLGPRGPSRQQRARPVPRSRVPHLGRLSAQAVRYHRGRQAPDPGRLLQRLEPRQLGEPEHGPLVGELRRDHRLDGTAAQHPARRPGDLLESVPAGADLPSAPAGRSSPFARSRRFASESISRTVVSRARLGRDSL